MIFTCFKLPDLAQDQKKKAPGPPSVPLGVPDWVRFGSQSRKFWKFGHFNDTGNGLLRTVSGCGTKYAHKFWK
jgi:hypothetical protein